MTLDQSVSLIVKVAVLYTVFFLPFAIYMRGVMIPGGILTYAAGVAVGIVMTVVLSLLICKFVYGV